ncbi:MAG: molybdopterin-binding protein [Candidatus Limnocylindrales bacterium]|jgi:nicotinamide-nucleotide amidase
METPGAPARPILTAVLLAVGSELTTGETRDTNSGELARSLSEAGVDVAWISALPDRLGTVVSELRAALAEADLVVTTGGLGPTPDDLTREAIAAACGEEPAVDPELARWLRHLFERRGIVFPETNLKQAWLLPSAIAIPNDRGTAPGWWVERPDGRVIVAVPGPPSEMRPMWQGWVLPRLRERGLGRQRVTRTYRLTGIGESAVAALLGERLLRAENPVVATYARADAVDVRVSAVAGAGRSATQLVDEAAAAVLTAVGRYVWGHDDDTWPAVLGRAMETHGWDAALVEVGTGGSAARLLGEAVWLKATRSMAAGDPGAGGALPALAEEACRASGAAVGLAVRAVETAEDTRVEVAAVGPWGASESNQTAFLGGSEGRRRAGIAAAAFLNGILRDQPGSRPRSKPPSTGGQ